jgi:putative ABC transport system permease protein
MFYRILWKSFINRKGSIALALVAVIVGAAVPTAMLTVSMDVEENVNTEFRKFGANLLLVPRSDTIDVGFGGMNFGSVTEQKYINETDLSKIKTISWQENILGYAPALYQVVNAEATAGDQQVVLVGTWFEKDTLLLNGKTFKTGVRNINSWWDVKGSWANDEPVPGSGGGKGRGNETGGGNGNETRNGTGNETLVPVECMIGKSVAEKLDLGIGDEFSITYRERPEDALNETEQNLTVVGIVTAGADEDNQIFTNLDSAQELTDRDRMIHTVQVSALCISCPVDTFAAEIEAKLPYVEAKTVKQLTSAEMSVLHKIEDMMFMVTIVALFATAMGVSTTMTASVISRQKEIGLMKSIGAENKRIAALFFMESTIIGLLGGVIGFGVGYLLAQLVGLSVFDTSVALHLIVLPVVVGISIAVSLVASAIPVKRAVRIEPVIVLRGE